MIEIIDGDVTQPEEQDIDSYTLAHCCNNVGVYGGGVSGAVHKRWPKCTEQYLRHIDMINSLQEDRAKKKLALNPLEGLGSIAFYRYSAKKWIANIIGQYQIIGPQNKVPLQYPALEEGLKISAKHAIQNTECNLILPYKIGCVLAGGDWNKVNEFIEKLDKQMKVLNIYLFKL